MNASSNQIDLFISMIICAFLTHHTRDATRHGFCIHPFGDTMPIPYKFYIFLTNCIPYILLGFLKLCDRSIEHKYRIIVEV